MHIISTSPIQTQELAAAIARLCKSVDCMTLNGDLGPGKTCFSQGFIAALTDELHVQSPTFLLVKPYRCTKLEHDGSIYHMDFYRLEHQEELIELGLEEYLEQGICLIEWPEIASNYLPDDRLDIAIEHLSDNERKIIFHAKGDWQKRLNNVYFGAC